MKYFVNILKQFTQTQRLIVLILLLSFTTGSYLISQYLKTDNCRPLIEENLKMHEDFAKISAMLRAQMLKGNQIQSDTMSIIEPNTERAMVIREDTSTDSVIVIKDRKKQKEIIKQFIKVQPDSLFNEIIKIAERNKQ
jgi:flagellar biosynthesis protein FliP